MAEFRYKSGLSSVGQYQMSGVPFATASLTVPALGTAPLEVPFQRITKSITVRNIVPTGSAERAIRVGFSSLGTSGSIPANQNFFTLANGESFTGEWRVTKIFLLCDTANQSSASVIAGLTTIATGSIPNFNSWSGSVGVG
jgi:hypothetical protein